MQNNQQYLSFDSKNIPIEPVYMFFRSTFVAENDTNYVIINIIKSTYLNLSNRNSQVEI